MFYIRSDNPHEVVSLCNAIPHDYKSGGGGSSSGSGSGTLYTVMRTIGKEKKIVEYEYHLKRLNCQRGEEILNLIRETSTKISADVESDYKIYLFYHQSEGLIEIFIEELAVNNETFLERIKFTTKGPRRMGGGGGDPLPKDPSIKDVDWMVKRKFFSNQLNNFNDVIMQEGSLLLEGLSSNFAIILKDHCNDGYILKTAPTSLVLGGSIMRVVIEIFKGKVVLECPSIEDVRSCCVSFITSTSRLLQPIREIVLDGDDDDKIIVFPHSSFLLQLKNDLVNILQERSLNYAFFKRKK